MPIYEYQCCHHGLFEAERPMARSAEPAECPVCALAARRVLSVPRTALLPRAGRIARERNEQSQHAPQLRQSTPAPPRRSRARPLQVSHGSRPWVLEHG
jgi:putative FmdB family regulatory protein